MHHIFVDKNLVDLDNKTIKVLKNADPDNFNHLAKSLRVNVGEKVLCSLDDFESSFDYLCDVTRVDADSVEMAIVENTKAKELPVNINLYQGITKSDKLEFIIEKSVELGVHSIVPLESEYCIAKIKEDKSEKKLDRYNKISKSAAEQSKRHIVPKVLQPITFDEFVKMVDINDKNTYNLLFYENAAGIKGTKDLIDEIRKVVANVKNEKLAINVIIGPEGGFSESEINKAKSVGINILSLGERILRTETAAVTALSILMYEFN